MPRPAAAAPTGYPTDPAVLAQVRLLVEEFAERFRTITGEDPVWEPGRSEADITSAETAIGTRLPEDLRALFRLVGQDRGHSGLLGRYPHLSLERLISE